MNDESKEKLPTQDDKKTLTYDDWLKAVKDKISIANDYKTKKNIKEAVELYENAKSTAENIIISLEKNEQTYNPFFRTNGWLQASDKSKSLKNQSEQYINFCSDNLALCYPLLAEEDLRDNKYYSAEAYFKKAKQVNKTKQCEVFYFIANKGHNSSFLTPITILNWTESIRALTSISSANQLQPHFQSHLIRAYEILLSEYFGKVFFKKLTPEDMQNYNQGQLFQHNKNLNEEGPQKLQLLEKLIDELKKFILTLDEKEYKKAYYYMLSKLYINLIERYQINGQSGELLFAHLAKTYVGAGRFDLALAYYKECSKKLLSEPEKQDIQNRIEKIKQQYLFSYIVTSPTQNKINSENKNAFIKGCEVRCNELISSISDEKSFSKNALTGAAMLLQGAKFEGMVTVVEQKTNISSEQNEIIFTRAAEPNDSKILAIAFQALIEKIIKENLSNQSNAQDSYHTLLKTDDYRFVNVKIIEVIKHKANKLHDIFMKWQESCENLVNASNRQIKNQMLEKLITLLSTVISAKEDDLSYYIKEIQEVGQEFSKSLLFQSKDAPSTKIPFYTPASYSQEIETQFQEMGIIFKKSEETQQLQSSSTAPINT